MQQGSITSTESFATRAQRSEAARIVLWIIVLLGMLLITLMRRGFGGVVMSDHHMFTGNVIVLVLALIYSFVLLAALRKANRAGTLLPAWVWRATAILD